MNREIRRAGIGYEDTEVSAKVNIYGIDFEIGNIDIARIENIDRTDKKSVEELIKAVIGEHSIEVLNEKRKEDGYSELGINQELRILVYLMDEYRKAVASFQGNQATTIMNISNDMNRRQRRDFNKQNHYKRGYYGDRNKRY